MYGKRSTKVRRKTIGYYINLTSLWKKPYQCLVSFGLTNVCVKTLQTKGGSISACGQPGSSALGLRRASLSQIVQCTCDSQTQTVSPHAWANHVGSMLLEYLDSGTDASVVIVKFFSNGSTSYKTTPRDTSNNYQLNTCSISSYESRARPILPEDIFQTSLTSLHVGRIFTQAANDKGWCQTGLETRLVQTAQRARETESGRSEEARWKRTQRRRKRTQRRRKRSPSLKKQGYPVGILACFIETTPMYGSVLSDEGHLQYVSIVCSFCLFVCLFVCLFFVVVTRPCSCTDPFQKSHYINKQS